MRSRGGRLLFSGTSKEVIEHFAVLSSLSQQQIRGEIRPFDKVNVRLEDLDVIVSFFDGTQRRGSGFAGSKESLNLSLAVELAPQVT
jgi:hypothetical protein